MEKILFKKIASSFAVAGLIFFILFAYLLYSVQSYFIGNHMDEMLLQIEQAYEKTYRLNEKLKTLIERYIDTQVGEQNILEELELEESLEMILHSTPTIYDESIGAVDMSTGEIIGMTKNNRQGLEIEGVTSKEELLKVLETSHKKKLLKVNGTYQFLKTREVQGSIIVFSLFAGDKFLEEYALEMCLVGFIILFFIGLLMIELRRYIKKYILKDFLHIESQIKQFIHGESDISFDAKYDTELKSLSVALNDWKDDCEYKAQRMMRIINVLSRHVAIFECLYTSNNHFFTDNIAEILGVSETQWQEIICKPNGFEKYITHLIDISQEKDLIYTNNKIITIKSYKVKDEFYGLIVDKTEEIHSAHQIENELQRIKETADKDTLTGLFNRHALEKYIKERVQNYPNQGIMLIFDLDNFKPINDLLGHPEGDKLLKIFAEILRDHFRNKNMIARLGGDEFVVFIEVSLPIPTLMQRLEDLLEDVRNRLNDYYIEYNISTSIGVAYVAEPIDTYEELYKSADVALYIAKRMGKDQYFINEDDIRCMRGKCASCRGDCKKRKTLGL